MIWVKIFQVKKTTLTVKIIHFLTEINQKTHVEIPRRGNFNTYGWIQ